MILHTEYGTTEHVDKQISNFTYNNWWEGQEGHTALQEERKLEAVMLWLHLKLWNKNIKKTMKEVFIKWLLKTASHMG